MSLSGEQIAALAPDAKALAARKQSAAPRLWDTLGRSNAASWGECKGSAVYQVRVALDDLAARCSCPSREFPCNHSLGLLLLAADCFAAPSAFSLFSENLRDILRKGSAKGGRLSKAWEVRMKRVTLVCKTCGNEERIEIMTRDDLEKRPRPTQPARCSKCGSGRVELHD